jgi:hypothetical protein
LLSGRERVYNIIIHYRNDLEWILRPNPHCVEL